VAAERETEQDAPTPLVESAIRMHEAFLAFLAGGFDRDDALTLVVKMTLAAQQATEPPDA
jgi:hypothetical protein